MAARLLDRPARLALAARGFPPPWLIAELEACFVVIDSAGQKLAYVYYDDEPQRRAAAKLLTKDEARPAVWTMPKNVRTARLERIV